MSRSMKVFATNKKNQRMKMILSSKENPDKIFPLKYSKIEIKPEKANTKDILLNFLK